MMNVSFVTYSLSMGGAEQSLCILANELAAKGWGVSIISLEDSDSPPYYALHESISIYQVRSVSEARSTFHAATMFVSSLRAIRRLLRAIGPDIIVSFLDWVNVLSIFASRGLGIPIVYSERVDPRYAPTRRFWKLLRPLAYRLGDALVVLSSGCLEAFPTAIREQAAVIPTPIRASENKLVANSPMTSALRFIAVGRLVPQKGFDLLIEAFSPIANACPEWSLSIFGDGPLREELELRCEALGLSDQIFLPGQTEDVYREMGKSSVFVLSSRFEGFGRVLAEAMSCGLPVVSFDCPSGPSEIFVDGQEGFLVPREDVAALSLAMRKLVEDADLRRSMGEHAKIRSAAFSPETVTAQWETVFERVLRERGCD
jgi:glycosyltransferase involved in cell wall biosynthesis